MRSFALLDRPEVGQILFHPRPEGPWVGGGAGKPVSVEVADGVSVGGWLFPGQAPEAPVVVHFHGNGEIAAEYADIAQVYNQLGLTLLAFDYRGYGASTGQPTASALVADSVACFDAVPGLLAEAGLTPSATFLMGRSLGSAAALEVADRRPDRLAGLIIESGFAYTIALGERLSGMSIPGADEAQHGFGNDEKIARITLPTLILHGSEDWIIPVDDAHALERLSAAPNKKLVVISGVGHNDIIHAGAQTYFTALIAFVRDHMGTPG